jgi:uncharacterized membrane protein YdjX (TVP38/TMEM64 family)
MKNKFVNFIKKHWTILLVLFLVLGWMLYSYFSGGILFFLVNSDVSKVVEFLNSFGIFAWLIFVLLVILEVVLAPIPPLVLYVVSGILFGGFFGGVLTLFGNLIGAAIDFKLARRYGQKTVQQRIDKDFKKKFDRFFEKYGTLSIFILRINPLTTSDLVSYLSGFTKMKLFKFLIATALGLIPLVFIQTYLGELIISKNPFLIALTLIISVFYLIVFVYLIIISLKKNKN